MPFNEDDKKYLESLLTKRVTPVETNVTSLSAKLAELENIVKAQDARLSAQDVLIQAQQTQINSIQQRLDTEIEVNKSYRQLVKKLEIDIDDLEQYGRRYIVRVENIAVKENETEDELFESLKTEFKKLDYNLQRGDLKNFHRLGKVKKSDRGPDSRQCLIKFHRWGPRKALYGINKKARRPGVNTRMRVHNDLTKRRFDIFNSVQKRIEGNFGDSGDVFVYSDVNSNLKIRQPDGKAVGFNTLEEGVEIVRRIARFWTPTPAEEEELVTVIENTA